MDGSTVELAADRTRTETDDGRRKTGRVHSPWDRPESTKGKNSRNNGAEIRANDRKKQ